MKSEWIERYREAGRRERRSADLLVGFNANIDEIHRSEELDLQNVRPQHVEKVTSLKGLKKEIKYAELEEKSEEVELDFKPDLEPDKKRIGGQAGIISNFLTSQGKGVIFYTPFLSNELADEMNEKILYPTIDGDFVLKNVKDASNSDRTKKNLVFELEGSHRVIFSRKLRGFGPYFRKGVEENLKELENGVDRIIVGGFHDVTGNMESKLQKASKQLEKLDKTIHLEFVQRNETDELVVENIVPEVDSIGLDEEEMKELGKHLGVEADEGSLGEAFSVAQELIFNHNLSRVHIHTLRYHVTVVEKNYEISEEKIRDSMLYGELSALLTAGSGEFPHREDYKDFDMDDKHLHRLDELEHFSDFFEVPDFPETGIAEIKGLKVIAIPTLIHEDPGHVVGLGDIISSGSFTGEIT